LKPIIFKTYPGHETIPWVGLGEFPTPMERLDRFGEDTGFRNL
jgi:hypothetical protein